MEQTPPDQVVMDRREGHRADPPLDLPVALPVALEALGSHSPVVEGEGSMEELDRALLIGVS